ncbi:MAG TPA: dihydrofolate reductase family protein [Chloroflexia bacterium]|nr:dihydrofolate reductase family protein [Chloroflexia bacterium]
MTSPGSTRVEKAQSLETLYDNSTGTALPLSSKLASFYGPLRLPLHAGKPYVLANLVTSLDGVVSLGIEGKAGGKEISGSNVQDRALMGVLRAVTDAVVVGGGTLREGKGAPLTAESVFPPLADAYAATREALKKEGSPLAVIVTASGDLDPTMRLFHREQEVLVVTTGKGARHLRKEGLPSRVKVAEAKADGEAIAAGAVLKAIAGARKCAIVLVEGGPHLLGDFLGEKLIDEQFLTLSPQIVGRDGSSHHLGLVEGHAFAPDDPLWCELSVVKRCESHLFLRYVFAP